MSTVVTWPRTEVARWAGGLYLAYVVANVLASRVGRIGLSDDAALLAAVTDHELAFRLGLVAATGSALLFVLTAWSVYVLLRGVNEQLALLLLVLNAVGVAVQCASYLPLLALLGRGGAHGLGEAQLDGVAMDLIATHHAGFVTAQVFFSAWLFPLGWLVLRSGFLPRALGWLLLLDGLAVLFWFLQAFLLPEHPKLSYPSWAIGFIAEVGFALWLVVRGTSQQRHEPVAPVSGDPLGGAGPLHQHHLAGDRDHQPGG